MKYLVKEKLIKKALEAKKKNLSWLASQFEIHPNTLRRKINTGFSAVEIFFLGKIGILKDTDKVYKIVFEKTA